MEAELDFSLKPTTTSKMEQRKEFMHLKYIQKKFVHKSESPPDVLLQDLSLAVANRDILAVLQLYAEGQLQDLIGNFQVTSKKKS